MGRPTIRASIRSRSTKAVVVVRHRRRLWQCRGCGKQTSATAGTILDHTRLALSVWFYAAFLMATDKRGVSALLLDRQLGLGNHKTGWFAFHKMRREDASDDGQSEPIHRAGPIAAGQWSANALAADLLAHGNRDARPVLACADRSDVAKAMSSSVGVWMPRYFPVLDQRPTPLMPRANR